MDPITINDLRRLVRQHLLTDRMFGLDFVPLTLPASAPRRPPNKGSDTGRAPGSPGTPARPVTSSSARAQEPTRRLVTSSEPRPRDPDVVPTGYSDKHERLRVLDETQVRNCRRCSLCETRTQTVFGSGDPNARLVFVGEAPGYEEDQRGLPFVGKAGELLSKMIAAMGLSRDQVYICNVLKCRPPGNRTPTADEMLTCGPYLREQLDTIRPEVLVALGAPASKTLLNTAEPISRLRGRFHRYFFSGQTDAGPSIPVMPTFHPAYLLRAPEEKRKSWEDLKTVMEFLGLPRPKSGGE